MKKGRIILLLITAFCFYFTGCYTIVERERDSSSDSEIQKTDSPSSLPTNDDFSDNDLAPYGDWRDVGNYGRVWRPHYTSSWAPYADGHWAYNGIDWVWISNEPYGWVVYHYGYWVYESGYGWLWIPTRETWRPACVEWYQYNGMIAWAPRPYKNRRMPEPWERVEYNPWVIVNSGDFDRENLNTVRVRDIGRERMIPISQSVRTQPQVREIERSTQRTIPVVEVDRKPSGSGVIRTRPVNQPAGNDRTPRQHESTNPSPTPAVKNPAENSRTPVREDRTREKLTPEPKPEVKPSSSPAKDRVDTETPKAPKPAATVRTRNTKTDNPASSTTRKNEQSVDKKNNDTQRSSQTTSQQRERKDTKKVDDPKDKGKKKDEIK